MSKPRSHQDATTDGLLKTCALTAVSRRDLMRYAGGLAAMAAIGAPGRALAGGKFSYMGWEGYDQFLLAGDYMKTAGLDLDKTYVSEAQEIITKLRSSPKEVDICTPYFINDAFMVQEGLLQPLDLSKIPNFTNLIPTIKDAAEPRMAIGGKWYSAPFTWASIPLMYDAAKVKTAPTSWMDMLKPEFAKKSAIPADMTSVFATWGRAVTGNKSPNRMTHEELKKTADFLIDMKKNHLRTIAPGYGELADLFKRGEIEIAEGFEAVAGWVGDAAKVAWSYPKEGCMTYIEGFSIGSKAKDPEALHALINFALSPEAQVAGAEYNSMPVVNSDALPKLSEAARKMYPYDDAKAFFDTDRFNIEEMYLLEGNDKQAGWEDYIKEWERVMRA